MANKEVTPKKARVLTEEGRARIVAAQNKRWRRVHKEQKAAKKAAKAAK